ncbi:zinc-ribbon domain-containing protein [Actinopolymorpha alba]|uniref:zinc-ribbon domain-containing protein n=1 Tax=Actinopolymorpha alba TaxID=533267 RepID=UPI000A01894E
MVESVQCCGHEWQETIIERILGRRPQAGRGHFYCPVCESVWGSPAWLDPEVAAEWHEENDLSAWHVKPFSAGVVVKWRCSANPEHEWDAAVIDRSAGRLCPLCSTAGTSKIERAFLAAAQLHDADASAPSRGVSGSNQVEDEFNGAWASALRLLQGPDSSVKRRPMRDDLWATRREWRGARFCGASSIGLALLKDIRNEQRRPSTR